MDKRLGGPQSQSGHGGEEKNSQSLPGLKPPIIQPVAHRYTIDYSYSRNSDALFATKTQNEYKRGACPTIRQKITKEFRWNFLQAMNSKRYDVVRHRRNETII
jgi:hypothetical protein